MGVSVDKSWQRVPASEVATRPEGRLRWLTFSPTDVITITREGDSLWARITELKYQLFAEGQKEFFMKAVDAQIAFTVDGPGNVTGLRLHYGNMELTAQKMQ